MIRNFQKQQGLFLVLFVIALAALMAVVLFGTTTSSVGKRLDSASRNQQSFATLNSAMTQFLQLNMRLPCPADGQLTTGVEDPPPTTPPAAPTDTTACGSPAGIVPWKTLGMPQSAAVDSWGRMISYRVYDGPTGFTRANGLNLSDCLDGDVTLVYTLSGTGSTCNSTTHENSRSDFFATKGISVTSGMPPSESQVNQIAYVLISHGESGYGAYSAANPPSRLTMPYPGSKEDLNANSGGIYAVRDPSLPDIPANENDHYDDVVSYTLASDLVVAAKAGGRPWPLGMTLDRTDPRWAGWAGSPGTTRTPFSSGKIAFSGGPIMMNAYKTSGATRSVASKQVIVLPPFQYAIGAIASSGGGSGDLGQGEGLGFDFRVKRRILKVVLAGFDSSNQALITFHNGTTQVGQFTLACPAGSSSANFRVDALSDFNKVEIQAQGSTSSFSVASIAACMYDDSSHPACTLPGQDTTYNCGSWPP